MSNSTKRVLRERVAQRNGMLVAGAFNAMSARIVADQGFEAVYLTGAGLTNMHYGAPDLGIIGLRDVADATSRIRDAVELPLIVDADTGFGNALNVQRTVRGFERAGAAMIQLEDQDFPKRCGHLAGKSLVPADEMCGKLRAALDARASDGTLILARTDAVAVEGIDAAFERAERYLECGVDALFIEALRSPQQLDAACARFAARVPLLANMVEGGQTPVESAQALAERGFRIVIFPGGTARAVSHALQDYYGSLREHGTTAPWRARMLDFDQLNALIGTPALLETAERYR